jgi:hypothetical protein
VEGPGTAAAKVDKVGESGAVKVYVAESAELGSYLVTPRARRPPPFIPPSGKDAPDDHREPSWCRQGTPLQYPSAEDWVRDHLLPLSRDPPPSSARPARWCSDYPREPLSRRQFSELVMHGDVNLDDAADLCL